MGITLATKLTDVINETMKDPMVGILHHDEGVDLVPANLELSAMEFNLVNAMSRETALRNYLTEVREKYDYILICAFLIIILSRGQSHDEKSGIALSTNIKLLKTYRYLKVIFMSF